MAKVRQKMRGIQESWIHKIVKKTRLWKLLQILK